MKLTRKSIIENIYRLNYDKIQDKENTIKWIEILNHLAILDYKKLLENYMSELKYHNNDKNNII